MDSSFKEISATHVLKLSCAGGFENEPNCGRPLGMRFDRNGYLIVIDAYQGLYKVNVATGIKMWCHATLGHNCAMYKFFTFVSSGDFFQLFPSSMIIGDRAPSFMNDLDIAADGKIYFSDSSLHQRREFVLDILDCRTDGRSPFQMILPHCCILLSIFY